MTRHGASVRVLSLLFSAFAGSALSLFSPMSSPASTAPGTDVSRVEEERRRQPAGNLLSGAMEAFVVGAEAEGRGDGTLAAEAYTRSSALDGDFLPSRLASARLLAWTDPPKATESLRGAVEIGQREFRAQRWLVANTILGAAVAGLIASLLVVIGLLGRHLRALHHALGEAIAATLRSGRRTSWLAALVLLLPFGANLGLVVTLLFLTFVASFRFGRGERFLALGAAAFTLLFAPLLLIMAPLWARDLSGFDAHGLAEAQQTPTSAAHRAVAAAWGEFDGASGIPHYLDGLSFSAERRTGAAVTSLQRAIEARDVPPRILENNLGNTELVGGNRDAAIERYRRAIDLEPAAFEPHYNLALVNAAVGRYRTADRDLERASRVDLERLRALGRTRAGGGAEAPLDAIWSASELWALALGARPPALAPSLLTTLLPLRSLIWAAPLVAIAVGLGLVVGNGLRRLIRVHVCYECATPICRRCLVRISRRAYCGRCAEGLGGRTAEEATRVLLRRLLEERPAWSAQLGPWVVSLAPGVGPILRGLPSLGAFTAISAGVAGALLTQPLWGQRLIPTPWPDPAAGLAQLLGLGVLALTFLATASGARIAERRTGMRYFLARDVDRLAA